MGQLYELELEKFDITIGAPLLFGPHEANDGIYAIAPKSRPYVFYATKVSLYGNDPKQLIILEKQIVMMGHGNVQGPRRDDWIFIGNKRSVEETVKAYASIAELFGLPLLDILIVCRPNNYPGTESDSGFKSINFPYVYPDSIVTLTALNMHDRWIYPNEGAVIRSAEARRWNNRGFYEFSTPDRRDIPDKFKQPAL